MLQYSRQSLLIASCTVILLDMAFLLGGSLLIESSEITPDWLYSEFELEETEENGEEEPLIQDAELFEVSAISSLYHGAPFCANESIIHERHVSRGPPTAC